MGAKPQDLKNSVGGPEPPPQISRQSRELDRRLSSSLFRPVGDLQTFTYPLPQTVLTTPAEIPGLQHSHERHQVPLLLCRQIELQHKIEELNSVFQGKQAAVV